MQAVGSTLMFTRHRRTGVTAWHFGADGPDGDHHDRVLPPDAASVIPALLDEYSIPKSQLLLVEMGETAPDFDVVLAACGNRVGSIGRFTPRMIVAQQDGEN